MVTIGMNYKVIKGKEQLFESKFDQVVDVMQGVDGHTESHVFRDVHDPQHYLIISQWSKREAFDAFISSDIFRQTTSWGREEVLSDRPRHEIFGE